MITQNPAGLYPWSKDLEASSDVRLRERPAFAMLLGWLEKFVCEKGLHPGREACERFWKEAVKARVREGWQLEQWGAAVRWYLRWVDHQKAAGGEVRSLPERVRDAVYRAGARRGHAPRTRETYARWAAAFAAWAGDDRAMMRPEKGRDFLVWQVDERKVSYSTQKQALNALAFFYKAVCGMEEVDLEVRLRKTEARIPVVLEMKEVLRVFDEIDEKYSLMARMQYGGGLRLMELVRLRVKDVDVGRGTVTVRRGKGDKDYPRLRRGFAKCKVAPPRPWRAERQVAGAVGDGSAEEPGCGDRQAGRTGEGGVEEGPGGGIGRGPHAGCPGEEVSQGGGKFRVVLVVSGQTDISGPGDAAPRCGRPGCTALRCGRVSGNRDCAPPSHAGAGV
jgi:hypothetical protein